MLSLGECADNSKRHRQQGSARRQEQQGKGSLSVTSPVKPCCSVALTSPVLTGSKVGRAALLDPDGREDQSKVDESKL